jgi:hypothetical protein
VLTVLCVLLASCYGQAAELRVVEAARASGAITVDGALSEAAWQEGEWSSGFTLLDNPAKAPAAQTRFKVRYDEGNLYVGARLDEPQTGDLRAEVTERDGQVYHDDCLEVMVDPTGERIEYYHFVVNPLGTLYDAQLRQGGNVRTSEWNCDAGAAAKVGEGAWTVELRIPAVELGLSAASKGDWALNVARERRAVDELSSFVPTTGGFHQPSLYAVLRLPGADFGRYLWEIKEPYEVRISPGEDGKLRYAAKTHVLNAGPRFRFIVLRGVLGGKAGAWVKGGLDSGQGREYAFSAPVTEMGPQEFRLELADRRSPDTLLAAKSQWVDVQYSPLSISFLQPAYRDSIYATEKLDALVFQVSASVPPEELAKLTLRAELRPQGQTSGKPIASAGEPAKAEATVRVAIPALPDGDYELTASLVAKGSAKPAYTVSKLLRKLPKVEHEWRLDAHNVLLHNGEAVLPFGWFSIPADEMAKPGHAYTVMQEYNTQYRSVEENFAVFDRVVAAGTYLTGYPYPGNSMMSPSSVWGQPLSDEEAQALRERVGALKGHPGVFAWYMADEPELRPALPERCRRIYEVVAREDPFHPCIMLNDTIEGIYKYADGGDILMPDPYPCFIKGGLAAQPIEKVSNFVKAAVEAGKGRKAAWVTPQAFNYGDYGRKNQRGPTLVELRNELYQAVVAGAKGFLWYTYSQVANYPELNIGMPWLSFEAADLKDAILADPDATTTVKVEAPKPEHIHASVRRVKGDIYLFAVNTATEAQDVTLRLEPAPKQDRLQVVSESRTVPLTKGEVADRFEVYETHIYTTSAAAGSRESIQVPLKRIAEANAARKKPGNLAFEESGATVEVSSRSTYGSTPDRVLDGILTGMRWQDGTPKELPDWLVVRWPAAVTVGRVVVYSSTIADCEIQVPEGDGWRTVAESLGNSEDHFEVVLQQPVETEAIRILVTGLREGQDYAVITEVEAYAR